jgi:hypothetical protein
MLFRGAAPAIYGVPNGWPMWRRPESGESSSSQVVAVGSTGLFGSSIMVLISSSIGASRRGTTNEPANLLIKSLSPLSSIRTMVKPAVAAGTDCYCIFDSIRATVSELLNVVKFKVRLAIITDECGPAQTEFTVPLCLT